MEGTRLPDHRRRAALAATWDVLTAISMTVGRGPTARAVAAAARLTDADLVVDIGCGPGTAVREAARRGASAAGVDPAPAMLRLARWLTAFRRANRVAWIRGRAEDLPLPDGAVTVVWALSSLHHWQDRQAGIREISRVLKPGGRLLLAERLARPGGRGHSAHGLTAAQAEAIATDAATAGFADLRITNVRAGRRALVLIEGTGSVGSAADPSQATAESRQEHSLP